MLKMGTARHRCTAWFMDTKRNGSHDPVGRPRRQGRPSPTATLNSHTEHIEPHWAQSLHCPAQPVPPQHKSHCTWMPWAIFAQDSMLELLCLRLVPLLSAFEANVFNPCLPVSLLSTGRFALISNIACHTYESSVEYTVCISAKYVGLAI